MYTLYRSAVGRGVHRPLAQVSRVVHAAIRCRVDLDDVEAGRSAPDALARRALAARLAIIPPRAALAVERHRQDARQRRLPRPARAAKQVAVRYTVMGDGAFERRRDVRLHRDIGERLRTVFAGESERH